MYKINLKPFSVIKSTYPELLPYLNKFLEAPQAALLGNFTYPERFIVEHNQFGKHTIVAIPKMDGLLRSDLIEELYVDDKLHDTFELENLPYDKEINYEIFLVTTAGSRAYSSTQQPEIDEKSLRFIVDVEYNSESEVATGTFNGVDLSGWDSETGYFVGPAADIEPIMHKVPELEYHGGIIGLRYPVEDKYYSIPVGVMRGEFELHDNGMIFRTCEVGSYRTAFGIYIEDGLYHARFYQPT